MGGNDTSEAPNFDTTLLLKPLPDHPGVIADRPHSPLTDKYVALDNLAIVYCLLANRLQFIDDSNQLPQARLNLARAHLCELLAIRVLNHYSKATEPLQHPHMSHHHPTSLNPLIQGSAAHTHVGPSMFPRTNTAGTTGTTGTTGTVGTVGTVGTAGTGSTRPSPHDRRRSLAVEGARQRRMSMAEPKITRMARKRADELRLANVLIAGFHPFAGAPAEVLEEEEMEGRTDRGKACNALELAIVTEAKHFIGVSEIFQALAGDWELPVSWSNTGQLLIARIERVMSESRG